MKEKEIFTSSTKTKENLIQIISSTLMERLTEKKIEFKLVMTSQPFNEQCPSHIETSPLICFANQLTGFYMRGTLAVKGLR